MEQVLNGDLHEQRWEAPVVFHHVDSHGPQENLQQLADRQAQLGLALEGLSVKPKAAGSADIRGLVNLSKSTLHIVVSQQARRQLGKRVLQFPDLLKDLRPKLGRPLRVYVGSPHSATRTAVELILCHLCIRHGRMNR